MKRKITFLCVLLVSCAFLFAEKNYDKYEMGKLNLYFFADRSGLSNGMQDALIDFMGNNVILPSSEVEELISNPTSINNDYAMPNEIKKLLTTKYDYCVMFTKGEKGVLAGLMYVSNDVASLKGKVLTVLAEDYDALRQKADESTRQYLQQHSANMITPGMTSEEMAEINRKNQKNKNKR